MQTTLIYPPLINFDWMFQRPQQLCKFLAEQENIKVVFCQSVPHALYGLEAVWTSRDYLYDTEIPNLQLCYNIERYFFDYRDKENIILYASSGPGHTYTALNPYAFIYDELDDFPCHADRAVDASVKADRIIYSANSIKLILDKRKERYPEMMPYTFCPNGCDFESWSFPFRTISGAKPNICYIGPLAPWLDFEFICGMIGKLKKYNFWFIGPDLSSGDRSIKPYIDWLIYRPNVSFIGHTDYRKLLFFAKSMDMFWIPFDMSTRPVTLGKVTSPVNVITNAVRPIKFFEALATGRPILFSQMPDLMDIHNELSIEEREGLFPITNLEESANFVEDYFSVENYFSSIIPEGHIRRQNIARKYTWSISAKIMSGVIDDILHADLTAERTERAEKSSKRKRNVDRIPEIIKLHEPTELVDLV